MQSLLDDSFHKIDLSKYNFYGKLAGKHWKIENALERLSAIRFTIFAMSGLVYWPILTLYAFHDFFDLELFLDRLIYSVVLFCCGWMFPKFRLYSLIVALIPIGLILLSYLLYGLLSEGKEIIFLSLISLFVLYGIYNHFIETNLRQALIREVMNGNPDARIKDFGVHTSSKKHK